MFVQLTGFISIKLRLLDFLCVCYLVQTDVLFEDVTFLTCGHVVLFYLSYSLFFFEVILLWCLCVIFAFSTFKLAILVWHWRWNHVLFSHVCELYPIPAHWLMGKHRMDACLSNFFSFRSFISASSLEIVEILYEITKPWKYYIRENNNYNLNNICNQHLHFHSWLISFIHNESLIREREF